VSQSRVESDLQALLVRRLVSASDDASKSVSPNSDLLREAARGMASCQDVNEFHSALANRLEQGRLKEQPDLRLLSLAEHYEQLGRYRELARSHLEAIRSLAKFGVPGDTDREYERGIAWFMRPEAALAYPGARHVHRLYVKRYLNSLWSRNLYARARRLFAGTYVNEGVPVPRSFWPKYVRCTLDIDGPPVARRLLRRLDVSALPDLHELRLLMGLEDALVSFQEGKRERALATVRIIGRHRSKLHAGHRHRVRIYEAMCLQALGRPMKAALLLQRELPEASADGSVDEAVLMQTICASITIYGGDTAGGLRQVARALRAAHKHRLYFRMNSLYRLAAATYVDSGKYQQAIRAQMRAIQSSYTIGMTDYVAIGWQRLAGYERAMGMFGNAIRYIERARASLRDSGNANHWSQVNRLRYELAVCVRSRDRHGLTRRRREWTRRGADVSEHSNLEFALGQYAQLEGRLNRAREHFASARALGIRAGMIENAVMAAGAEVRTLYEMGRPDKVADALRFVKSNVGESSSITLRAERCIVAIHSAYLSRDRRCRPADVASEVRAVWDELESAKTRSEIALMLFRLFARTGEVEVAQQWADLYMAELRRMFANLTETADAEGVARLVGMKGARSEIESLMRRTGQYAGQQ
jgi:tetratricopeptide (TPR) repeat protein